MSVSTVPWRKDCPASGAGVHAWLYGAACACVKAGLADEEAAELITQHMTREPSPSNEVESALASARGARSEASPKWPAFDAVKRAGVCKEGGNAARLCALSPVKWADGLPHSEEIIDRLFPGAPLLCVGREKNLFATKPRPAWRDLLDARQFIVPNPMAATTGTTKDGKESARCLDNTGPRRFLVIEADHGTEDQQAAVLLHLAEFLPLALVVHSGGKSLHGWFFCAGLSDEQLLPFMRCAVELGADPRTWGRCQLVRMPDGTRTGGKRQRVLFFNPEVVV